MADNKGLDKKPGEKKEGKYHYNPGNMADEMIESAKPESEQENNADSIRTGGEPAHKR